MVSPSILTGRRVASSPVNQYFISNRQYRCAVKKIKFPRAVGLPQAFTGMGQSDKIMMGKDGGRVGQCW